MRALNADIKNALRQFTVRIVLLVEVDHPTGMVRLNSGVGPIEWDGSTWVGVGRLGQVAPMEQDTELRIQEVHYSLSGIPADAVGLINQSIQGRYARLWLGFLTPEGNLISEPLAINETVLDRPVFALGGDATAVVTFIGFNGLINLENPSLDRWSPESQPVGDSGLDRIHIYEDAEVTWTRT